MVQFYTEPVCRFQKKTVREYSHEMKTDWHTSYNLATYMFLRSHTMMTGERTTWHDFWITRRIITDRWWCFWGSLRHNKIPKINTQVAKSGSSCSTRIIALDLTRAVSPCRRIRDVYTSHCRISVAVCCRISRTCRDDVWPKRGRGERGKIWNKKKPKRSFKTITSASAGTTASHSTYDRPAQDDGHTSVF